MDRQLVTSSTSVERIYENIKRRLSGIIKALTSEFEEFYRQCDPEKENLCLYGLSNGGWKVRLPGEDVPAELPEPAIGINFARDGMLRKDWLTLVALHSDAWLLGLASFYAAELNRTERKRLLTMISCLPSAYDVITGKDIEDELSSVDQLNGTNTSKEGNENEADGTSSYSNHLSALEARIPDQTTAESNSAKAAGRGNKEAYKDSSGKQVVKELSKPLTPPTTSLKERDQVPQGCPRPQKSKTEMQVTATSEPRLLEMAKVDASPTQYGKGKSVKRSKARLLEMTRPVQTSAESASIKPKKQVKAKSAPRLPEPVETHEHSWEEEYDDTLCDICRGHNTEDDLTFWIACDCCEKWFHCKCVRISPAKAEHMKHFKCPLCTSKRALLQLLP